MSESGMPPPSRSRAVSVLLIVLGIILLLPGLCALYLAGIAMSTRSSEFVPAVITVILGCFAVAGGGVALMVWGFRRLR